MASIVSAVTTANWNTNGAWVGSVQPTAADDVTIVALSNITIPAATTCLARSVTVAATGTLTWASSATAELDVGDSGGGLFSNAGTIVLGATLGKLKFLSTQAATTFALTTGGQVMPNIEVATATTTTIQFADALTATGATITLTTGVLDTNSKTITCSNLAATTSNTKTWTWGSSAINLNGTGAAVSFAGSGTTITLPTTATITFTGAGAGWSTGGNDFGHSSWIVNGSGFPAIGGSGTPSYGTITRTGTAIKTDGVSLTVSLTVKDALTLNGQGANNRLLVQSSVAGTARTITNTGVVPTMSYVDFQDIALSSAFDASAITGLSGDCGGNSGITFTTAAPQTAQGTVSFSWSNAAKWTSRVPLPQDNVTFGNAFSASQNVTMDMPRLGAAIDFTGTTGTPNAATSAGINPTFYGSWTNVATGLDVSKTNQGYTASGRSTHTITTAGFSFGGTLLFQNAGGTYTAQDSITAVSNISIMNGTFTTTFNITGNSFIFNSGLTHTVNMGGGTWTATGTGNSWNNSNITGFTLNSQTSTISITDITTATKTFIGGASYIYNNLTVASGRSCTISFSQGSTFNTLTVPANRVLTMQSAITNTFTNFSVNGSPNGYLYIPNLVNNYASTPDTAALSVPGSITIDAKVNPNAWIPSATQTFVAKYQTGTQRSYLFRLDTAGKLNFIWSTDGTATISVTSSVATGLTGANWVRVVLTSTNPYNVKFYTSSDGITFNQLGSTTTGGAATSIFDSTSILEIGTDSGGVASYAGAVYQVRIYSDASQTTKVFDADFTASAIVGNSTFTESSSNAATVTLNGNLAIAGTGCVVINSSSGGSAATISSGTQQCLDYLRIQDSTATGSGGFFAGTHSVSVSNVTGWVFTGCPVGGGGRMLLMGTGI